MAQWVGGGRRRTSAWRMGGPGVAGAAACAGGGPGVAGAAACAGGGPGVAGVGPGAAAGAAAGPGVAGAAAGAAAADAPSRRPPDACCGVRGGGPGTCTAAAGGAARAGSVRDASAWLGGRAAAVSVGRGRAAGNHRGCRREPRRCGRRRRGRCCSFIPRAGGATGGPAAGATFRLGSWDFGQRHNALPFGVKWLCLFSGSFWASLLWLSFVAGSSDINTQQ
jgi:hypothetical protein